jgi:hypothetical protein
LSTSDTVDFDTPADFAMSMMVAARAFRPVRAIPCWPAFLWNVPNTPNSLDLQA